MSIERGRFYQQRLVLAGRLQAELESAKGSGVTSLIVAGCHTGWSAIVKMYNVIGPSDNAADILELKMGEIDDTHRINCGCGDEPTGIPILIKSERVSNAQPESQRYVRLLNNATNFII